MIVTVGAGAGVAVIVTVGAGAGFAVIVTVGVGVSVATGEAVVPRFTNSIGVHVVDFAPPPESVTSIQTLVPVQSKGLAAEFRTLTNTLPELTPLVP